MAGSDVKITRVTATGAASIGRCRLVQVLVTTAGSGTPQLKLDDTDGSGSGPEKLNIDLQTGETDTISIPAQGILFEADIHVTLIDDITSAVLFTV